MKESRRTREANDRDVLHLMPEWRLWNPPAQTMRAKLRQLTGTRCYDRNPRGLRCDLRREHDPPHHVERHALVTSNGNLLTGAGLYDYFNEWGEGL